MFIGAMLLAGMMMVSTPVDAQTRKQKKEAKQKEWEHQQKMKEIEREQELQRKRDEGKVSPAGSTFELPCSDVARSDKEYYRQLGIGKDVDLAIAQQTAVQNAKSIIRDRLGEQVKGLATDYSKTFSKSGKGADMEKILEREFTSIVDKALEDADNPCERAAQLPTGEFQYYYVVEIAKKDLTDKMAQAITDNDKLRAEFDRDQFRKYAEGYMQKMKDAQ